MKTGYFDKNGIEISIGDIVIIDNTPDDEPPGSCDVETTCIKYDWGVTLEDVAGGHWTRQLYHQPDRLSIK